MLWSERAEPYRMRYGFGRAATLGAMAASDNLGGQFERMTVIGIPGGRRYERLRAEATVPSVPEGHTRLWRSTNIDTTRGHWGPSPSPGYGTSLYHMDVPNHVVPTLPSGEHRGSFLLDHPLPGVPKRVKYENERPE